MASLQNAQIDQSYGALLKTDDNGNITATPKAITDGAGNATNIQIGTTETKFPSGTVDFTGSTVNGLPPSGGFTPIQLSGTAQTLDLGQYNFFDGGALTGDTTLTFSNSPTEKAFGYSYQAGSNPYSLDGGALNNRTVNMSGNPSTAALAGFSYDGTRMWILRNDTTADAIWQWNLSTAWDIRTATYASQNFNLESQDNQVGPGMYFKQDGLTFFTIGAQNDSVYEYTMTTANDLSTVSYSGNSFSVSAQDNTPRAVWFKPDGLKFYVLGNTDAVRSYTMSTAWDVTTATYDNVSFSVQAQDTDPEGLTFSEDGSKFFYAGATSNSIFEYNMSTPWDLSTASYNNISIDLDTDIAGDIRGVAFQTGGSQWFVGDRGGDKVIAGNSGVASIIFPASVQNAPAQNFVSGDIVTFNFFTLDGATNVYYEEQPEEDVASAAPGLISGAGANSIAVSSAVLSSPSTAQGIAAISIGLGSNAGQANNISIGPNNNVSQTDCIVIGDNNDVSAAAGGSVLLRPGGGTSLAFRGSSVCIGDDTYPGSGGVCIGTGATGLQNDQNIQIGNNSQSNADAIAIGHNADARGTGSVAIGKDAIADGSGNDGRVAIGKGADAGSNRSIAIGVNNPSCQSEGIAIGDGVSISSSDRSIAIGGAITLNSGNDKVAIGTNASVAGQRGLAFGQNASATANEAIAMGYNVTAAKAQTLAVNELETKLVGGGITMVSPNGTEYKLTVSDAGALVIT